MAVGVRADLTVVLWAAWMSALLATEEWCEEQPGGRGGPPLHALEEAPPQCR